MAATARERLPCTPRTSCALGGRRGIDTAGGQLADELGLARLRGVDGGTGGGHRGFVARLHVARGLDVVLQLRQERARFLRLRVDLPDLGAKGLEVALHAL